MGKMLLSVFFGLVVVAGASTSFALQSGGVEVGDLETGSVVGQPFKELDIDSEIFAIEIGNTKVWYPPVTVMDFKSRGGAPVVMKVTNNSSAEHGFTMMSIQNQQAPTSLKAQLVLKPGETRYIGIPTSDFLYSSGTTLSYYCQLHPAHIGGKLILLK